MEEESKNDSQDNDRKNWYAHGTSIQRGPIPIDGREEDRKEGRKEDRKEGRQEGRKTRRKEGRQEKGWRNRGKNGK
jgi:hypothetical protein